MCHFQYKLLQFLTWQQNGAAALDSLREILDLLGSNDTPDNNNLVILVLLATGIHGQVFDLRVIA